MVKLKEIKELYEFLDSDLPTKIFPDEIIKGELWSREDSFKDKEQIRTYLKNAFQFVIPELKKETQSS